MHNDKRYLDEVLAVIYTEGISEVSIFERKGLGKSLYGIKNELFLGLSSPEITDEFDYALIAAVPGEQKFDQLKELIQADPQLCFSTEKGLMFTLPYGDINKLF